MAKIRDDFEGVVYVGGLTLEAGDKIPAGVRVGGHLTDSGKDVGPAPDEKPVSVAPVDVQDRASQPALTVMGTGLSRAADQRLATYW